jgi:protein-S-isoprenylcysteine O-methyltransferase Ste14
VWEINGVGRWGLWLLWLAGIWLTLRSAAILDIGELAGLTRPALRADGDNIYRTVGPYGWVRHPIYTGWFLLVFAVSPMTMTRLVFAVVSGVYLLIGLELEERSMRASPPGAYERYMQQVRWKLLPGIY